MLSRIGHATRTETTVGTSDGAVSLSVAAFTVDGGALRLGTTARLRLTIKNSGRGTAYRVIARTRSGLTELHQLRLSYGTLRPGESKARDTAVEIPSAVAEESAMVLVLIEEARSRPPSHQQRFAIAAANEPAEPRAELCATGRLTRVQYKEKLGRIRSMLDAGAITRQEFDQYEAELLACLD